MNFGINMREIKLSNSNLTFSIDDSLYDKVNNHTWYLEKSRSKSYPRTRINNKLIRLHRFILDLKDSKIHVDHINGDTLNNTIENLRICSNSENLRSVGKMNKKCSSKYKGVVLVKANKHKKWAAVISNKYYKTFTSELEAAKAYDIAARALYGSYSCLNFPENI